MCELPMANSGVVWIGVTTSISYNNQDRKCIFLQACFHPLHMPGLVALFVVHVLFLPPPLIHS